MMKLEQVRQLLDTDVSEALRQKVLEVSATHEGMLYRDRFSNYELILNSYKTEKMGFLSKMGSERKRFADIQILAVLFERITQSSHWTTNEFNYLLLLGRSVETVNFAWSLVDVENVAPSTAQSSIIRHVHEVHRMHQIPYRDICDRVLKLIREKNPEGSGIKGYSDLERLIRTSFDLPTLAEPGNRRKQATPSEPQIASAPSEPVIEAAPPSVPAAPKSKTGEKRKLSKKNGFKSYKKTRPTVPMPPPKLTEEEELMAGMRLSLNRLLEIRLAEVPEEDRPRIRSVARIDLTSVFGYVAHTCRRLSTMRAAQEQLESAQRRIKERRDYEAACRFFGLKTSKDELVPWNKLMSIYREQVKACHPDQNPGREEELRPQFQACQQHYAVIRDFHATNEHKGAQAS